MKVIAHIDMDAFFAAVEQRDNPQLRDKPVIVGADPKGGKGRGVVSTCSYEARKLGVRSAMPISRAFQLCPQGIFLPVDMEKYQAVSEEILNILYEFTPDIEPISIDEAFLDLTESFHFYETGLNACLKIKERIFTVTALTASMGLASNKMIAKLASDVCKPNGLLEVKEENILNFLWPLKVERLWGVGPKMKDQLNAMGIITIGDLAKASEHLLSRQFGKHGHELYQLALGKDDRAVESSGEIKSVSHEHTFDVDTQDKNDIYDILAGLSEKISRRLRKYDLKARTLSLKIRLKGFKTYSRAFTLPEPTQFSDIIFKKAKALFEEFYDSDMSVRLIGVRMSQFEDPDYTQASLFEDHDQEKNEKVHRAVDAIKDKFGEFSIRRGVFRVEKEEES